MVAADATGRDSPSWTWNRRARGLLAVDPSRFARVFAESGAVDFSPVAERVRRRRGRVVYTEALRVVWAGLSPWSVVWNVRGIRRIRIGWPQRQHSTGRLTLGVAGGMTTCSISCTRCNRILRRWWVRPSLRLRRKPRGSRWLSSSQRKSAPGRRRVYSAPVFASR